jgi:hypothetical protein
MSNVQSVTLHQQDGGMSVQAFADREGLTLKQARYCIKRGKVLGARQDARSKHWWIYPPAKLMERPRKVSHAKPQGVSPQAPAELPDLLAGVVAVAVEAGTESRQSGQYVPQVEAEGKCPPASPVLILEAPAELPGHVLDSATGTAVMGAFAPIKTADTARKPEAYTEVRSVCRMLHEAAARQFREGLHYLRLDAHEFAQLYAALGNDRSRVRKLVGRGLLPVGLLRASDSVWQKMQAMSREGRLL